MSFHSVAYSNSLRASWLFFDEFQYGHRYIVVSLVVGLREVFGYWFFKVGFFDVSQVFIESVLDHPECLADVLLSALFA